MDTCIYFLLVHNSLTDALHMFTFDFNSFRGELEVGDNTFELIKYDHIFYVYHNRQV